MKTPIAVTWYVRVNTMSPRKPLGYISVKDVFGHALSPLAFIYSLWRNRELIGQMSKRDVVGRYKGSFIGLGWSFINPILMLAVYTFVFSSIFKARWGGAAEESIGAFAELLFAGLIVHALFSEVVLRAPGLILSNVNYVKKVVFPLEVLPIIAMLTALFHGLISVAVLLAANILINGYVPWTALLLPVVLLPFVLVTIGFAWMLASLGVFLRDIGHVVGMITTVMLFLSPVFYPASALPAEYRSLLLVNPLTFVIEAMRKILIYGEQPDWLGLAIYAGMGLLTAIVGYWWFQRTRKGFADVV